MKFFVLFACLLAVAFANEDAGVLRSEAEVNPENFRYVIELDNGVKAEQSGDLKNGEEWVVNGAASHTSPEGESISIQYEADANGYKVLSANPPLPTPPPIPEAILKAIAYIEAHPSQE
ncbi:cuticular protein 47Eg [Drosophila sulfurigaster albostrigata]|uniref:cuticular protein 47Eg n=1 Tax=Drosophila sulfurigaster albostrigata TaxID=89887 RepID=UPI002D21ED58|nr:cuticular protein 47Eg [Drosophila sulfurigaster albostrigata]